MKIHNVVVTAVVNMSLEVQADNMEQAVEKAWKARDFNDQTTVVPGSVSISDIQKVNSITL